MRISDIKDPTVSYFQGNFAPVQAQLSEPCIEVIGTVPEALNGAFLRIGANPVFVNDPESYHPFLTRFLLMTLSLIIPSQVMA